ncbi:MAG: hypothetical protein KDC24_14740 [Saprospiraceae bacterium]|nr:hypothetical protein [Saprospiraceae bacterium]
MILVCDSGSTKADWKYADGVHPDGTISTMGFNPVFHKEDFIKSELTKDLLPRIDATAVNHIFFYGAGCWDSELKMVIKKPLAELFPNATIEVEHDLLGAARATCGDHPGIACILGTGSNSCSYDGTTVVDNVTNLGFMVGDEGSGSFLGKMLLRSYFYREMPAELAALFEAQFPEGKSEILNRVYNQPAPNVYLASFAHFLSDQKKHFFIENLVYKAFSEFVDRNVKKYKGHLHVPVHFIGSVAFHFSDILQVVMEERALKMGKIIKKPIDHLMEYHKGPVHTV